MTGFIDHEKAFISLFKETARYHHRFKVFEDFICCGVIAIQNKISFCQAREDKYLKIVNGYEKEDVYRFAKLMSLVVKGLSEGFCDFLGKIFMELNLGDDYKGQFFTPWSVARMMADMSLGNVSLIFEKQSFITYSDPACGAGCMLLAVADVLNRAGYISHKYMWVSAQDIDPLAAGMAYIQLSVCGVAAEVVIGNSLTNERRRVLLTPAHYLGNWSARLQEMKRE